MELMTKTRARVCTLQTHRQGPSARSETTALEMQLKSVAASALQRTRFLSAIRNLAGVTKAD